VFIEAKDDGGGEW